MQAEKLDLKKQMKALWQPPIGKFAIVDVPRLNFVKIDGKGDPNTAVAYSQAIQWLYSISYTLKFMSKAVGRDYSVAPLEGLWWSDDMSDFTAGKKDNWSWTAMIMQPEGITPGMFAAALDKTRDKLGAPPASVRFESFDEGLSVQTMHIGPYADEGPTIARLHQEFLPANGLTENGHHHEIYVGDPRRSAPDKLKTIIRQPVKRA